MTRRRVFMTTSSVKSKMFMGTVDVMSNGNVLALTFQFADENELTQEDKHIRVCERIVRYNTACSHTFFIEGLDNYIPNQLFEEYVAGSYEEDPWDEPEILRMLNFDRQVYNEYFVKDKELIRITHNGAHTIKHYCICPCGATVGAHDIAKAKHELNKRAMRTAVLPLSRMIDDRNVVKYIAQFLLWNINSQS